MSTRHPFPARLAAKEVAKVLGFAEHDLAILAAKKLLTPLGRPTPTSTKYFAKVEIMELAANEAWLDKATRQLQEHWKHRNARRRKQSPAQLEVLDHAAPHLPGAATPGAGRPGKGITFGGAGVGSEGTGSSSGGQTVAAPLA